MEIAGFKIRKIKIQYMLLTVAVTILELVEIKTNGRCVRNKTCD